MAQMVVTRPTSGTGVARTSPTAARAFVAKLNSTALGQDRFEARLPELMAAAEVRVSELEADSSDVDRQTQRLVAARADTVAIGQINEAEARLDNWMRARGARDPVRVRASTRTLGHASLIVGVLAASLLAIPNAHVRHDTSAIALAKSFADVPKPERTVTNADVATEPRRPSPSPVAVDCTTTSRRLIQRLDRILDSVDMGSRTTDSATEEFEQLGEQLGSTCGIDGSGSELLTIVQFLLSEETTRSGPAALTARGMRDGICSSLDAEFRETLGIADSMSLLRDADIAARPPPPTEPDSAAETDPSAEWWRAVSGLLRDVGCAPPPSGTTLSCTTSSGCRLQVQVYATYAEVIDATRDHCPRQDPDEPMVYGRNWTGITSDFDFAPTAEVVDSDRCA